MTDPLLETERLVLCPPAARDQGAYMDFVMSERAQYIGRKSSRFVAWQCFASEAGHWTLYGDGPWTVTWKGDDRSIGQIGVWHPEGFPERELGWLVWGDAEGKGVAFEAAQAAREHHYRNHVSPALVSYIDPQNARSIRLAERLGAHLDKSAVGTDPDDLVYRHPAPEEP